MSGSVELEKFIDELIKWSKEKGYTPHTLIDMRRQLHLSHVAGRVGPGDVYIFAEGRYGLVH